MTHDVGVLKNLVHSIAYIQRAKPLTRDCASSRPTRISCCQISYSRRPKSEKIKYFAFPRRHLSPPNLPTMSFFNIGRFRIQPRQNLGSQPRRVPQPLRAMAATPTTLMCTHPPRLYKSSDMPLIAMVLKKFSLHQDIPLRTSIAHPPSAYIHFRVCCW